MGLLSDPSLTPQNKIGKIIAKHHSKLCWLCYVASIVWFCCLAHNDFNHGTYLSENALSPGLVYPEITQDSSRLMQQYMTELEKERQTHRTSTPYNWIQMKMRQIGLETYTHNYTLKYPFAENKQYTGKNIYGILRAPRTSSTEGIVFSAPYRPPSSAHADITASIPTLLSFADFARKKNYWAKDLIFLITEHEQLGIHAFLQAYFGPSNNEDNKYLNYGYLPARAGALQAALNLEIQDLNVDCVDVKIEGLNGQLPNLDLFNVVQRIASREGMPSGYKQATLKQRRSYKASLESNLKHMLSMLLSQATGIPNGNHGHYHRHRIEALTVEGVRHQQIHTNANTNQHRNRQHHHHHGNDGLALLRIIEGTSRSLNNLLERFHQSYFFYILVQNDRFVSIGNYMPCLGWLILPLFAKAYLLWVMANGDNNGMPIVLDNDNEDEIDIQKENDIETLKKDATDDIISDMATAKSVSHEPDADTFSLGITPAILYIITAAIVGAMCRYPVCIDLSVKYLINKGLPTSSAVTLMICFWSLMACLQPFLYKLPVKSLYWLHFILLISLATILAVVGLLNFALAYLMAIFLVPLALIVNCMERQKRKRIFSTFYCLLLHPLIFIFILITVLTVLQFPELSAKHLIERSITATMDGITFSITDDLIYGNWLYTMVTCVLLPLWCGYWALIVTQPVQQHSSFTSASDDAKKFN